MCPRLDICLPKHEIAPLCFFKIKCHQNTRDKYSRFFFMCRKIDSCCWLFWHVYTPSLFFSHLGLCNSWHFVRDGEICYIRYQLCACCSLAGKWGFGKRRRTWKWYRPFHHFFEWIWMCFNLALYWAISASRLEYRLNTLILGYPWFLFSISL